MRWLKNPMANAAYVALITAIYAAIFIVSSEFVMSYENLLSDSGWASFIISQNMKFVGIGMIGVAVIVDTLSALRRKRYDECVCRSAKARTKHFDSVLRSGTGRWRDWRPHGNVPECCTAPPDKNAECAAKRTKGALTGGRLGVNELL